MVNLLQTKILFLDDSKERIKAFRSHYPFAKIVETSEDAIKALTSETFDVVFLDHDLGGEVYVDSNREDTGMEVVRWMLINKPTIPRVVIHTCNYVAGHLMLQQLKDALYNVKYIPYTRFGNTFYANGLNWDG